MSGRSSAKSIRLQIRKWTTLRNLQGGEALAEVVMGLTNPWNHGQCSTTSRELETIIQTITMSTNPVHMIVSVPMTVVPTICGAIRADAPLRLGQEEAVQAFQMKHAMAMSISVMGKLVGRTAMNQLPRKGQLSKLPVFTAHFPFLLLSDC